MPAYSRALTLMSLAVLAAGVSGCVPTFEDEGSCTPGTLDCPVCTKTSECQSAFSSDDDACQVSVCNASGRCEVEPNPDTTACQCEGDYACTVPGDVGCATATCEHNKCVSSFSPKGLLDDPDSNAG